MALDAPTLLLVTVILTFMVGSLFLLSWSQAREMHALAIWGIAHLIGGVGSALLALRGQISDPLSIGLANALMIGAYGLIWKGRTEPLVSRYPATILLAAYGVIYAVRIPMVVLKPPRSVVSHPLQAPAFAILVCLGMLLTVALAFVFMALTKERAERLQRLAADTDPLTGIANRRAFVAGAKATLGTPDRPATLLLADLDHFKRVNDTYGHAVGDAVLVGFCRVAEALMPPGTIVGRMGGEEFACLVTGDADEALACADGMRRAIAHLAVPSLPDLRIGVSIGVATTQACGHDLDRLMRAADDALYAAKRNGRNRIEIGGPGRLPANPDAALLDPHHHAVGGTGGVHHRDAGEAGALGTPHGVPPGAPGHGQAVDHPGQGRHPAQGLEGETRVRRAARSAEV